MLAPAIARQALEMPPRSKRKATTPATEVAAAPPRAAEPQTPPRERATDQPASAAPADVPAPAAVQPVTVGAELPDEPFVELPEGKGYESETESGPTAELVLDDEDLIGLPDTADKTEAPRVGGSPTRAATAAATVETGAAVAKKKTAAQERKEADDAKWTQLKFDGSETSIFGRPEFRPYKEGLGPKGFEFNAVSHEKGGVAGALRMKPTTHPAQYGMWRRAAGTRRCSRRFTRAPTSMQQPKGRAPTIFTSSTSRSRRRRSCAVSGCCFGMVLHRSPSAAVPHVCRPAEEFRVR